MHSVVKTKRQLNSPAFTIVELLVVIVVIGILAALTIVSYTGISQRATEASLKSDLTNASQQLKMYQVTNSAYPTSLDVNNCLVPASENMCLKPSPGNSYSSYTVNNSSVPQTFSLTATNGSTSYIITNDSIPAIVSTVITPVDLMEYSSDEIAQVGYVSNAGYDDYTKLLLHADGTDASTTFTDNETTPKAVTPVGTAQIDTAQSVFGGASLLLDGNSDYLTVPDHADWAFGSGDFTLEGRIRMVDATTDDAALVSQWNTGNKSWAVIIRPAQPNITFYYSTDGSTTLSKTVAWTPSTNIWYHLAVVRNGNNLLFFVNGTQVGATQDLTGVTFYNSAEVLAVGDFYGGTGAWFDGWIDEVRVSKGIARWTSDFTPPTVPYPDDLSDYSEPTIKQQGSYALKGIAAITTSLNKTITRTVSPTIDLSSQNQIQFDIRSSRTGTNLQAQIHDSGGTTSTHNINITSADTWQTETWDISGISGTDKDVIDQIIFKVINADAANTFYIDNIVSSD